MKGSSNKISKSKGPSKTFPNSGRQSKQLTSSSKATIKFRDSKHLKRRQVDSESSSEGSDSASSSSEDANGSSSDSEIEIKFELFNMAESDYHSIKQYLGNLFGVGEHGVDLVSLTSFIVEALADHVGTCIKTDGEESDPFGFITGFSLNFATKSLPQITESLQNFLVKKDQESEIKSFFHDSNNVMIFQERLINVPASIAGPLYKQFIDDWKMAESEESSIFATENDRKVLFITSTYKEVVSELDRELGLRESPQNFSSISTGINYYYEETEYLEKFSTKIIDFSVSTGHETSDSRRAFSENGIEPGRRIFLLNWSQFLKFVEHLQDL